MFFGFAFLQKSSLFGFVFLQKLSFLGFAFLQFNKKQYLCIS
jgi:hypothetical protein